jgi:large subunit ribosomal protein L29
MAKNETYTGKSAEELQGAVADLKKELFNLRFQKASGELTNTSRFREAKREIARILTQLRTIKNAA